MRVVDVYIVKKDSYNNYTLNNPLGNLSNADYKISVNDYDLTLGSDYSITNGVVIFTNPLVTGDKISIEYSISDSVKIVTKNSYAKDALYKIFSSNVKLKLNHTYTYSLNVEGENFSSQFYTKHDPFYTTVKKIRLDTGDLLDGATDFQIAQVIYMYSKEVYDTLNGASDIPVYATNVVRYKTDIDLCYAIYLSISGNYGKVDKKVGTIEISKEVKLPMIEAMIKRFKELLGPNEANLEGTGGTTAAFVRAGNTSYTVTNRGVF
jgi:hypothetical protein